MKKLLLIITLFVSSFFLFCRNEVKAVDINVINYNDTVLDVIDDNFFKIRTIVKEFAVANSYNYFIRYADLNIYHIYFVDSNITSLTSTGRSWFEFKNVPMLSYKIDDNLNLIYSSEISSIIMSSDYLYEILDTNLDIFYNPYTIQINYLNLSYVVDSTNSLPSLFDIYCDYFDYEDKNPHQEEIDKVTNFYTMIIEKIEYLSNEISNNYILLFVIGIFIVTFIFLLIFRRFL